MAIRILAVNDDAYANNIVRETVISRGHSVDVAESGLAGLGLVKHNSYDLALIDDQAPEIDGLTLAKAVRSLSSPGPAPKLVAISDDVMVLRRRHEVNEVFQDILPTPLTPSSIMRLVESTEINTDRCRLSLIAQKLWRDRGFQQAPRALTFPAPTREQAVALNVCFDLSPAGHPDCILLTHPAMGPELAPFRTQTGNHLLPVIDITGAARSYADASFNIGNPDSWNEMADVVVRFALNRSQLRSDVANSNRPSEMLLSYLFVSGASYTPFRDPSTKDCIRYPGSLSQGGHQAAEELASRGLLSKRFLDRFHMCNRCGSKRLNVREECLVCRSPNIQEADLIHHFRCAHQAPHHEFRSGSHLVCPKCQQGLRHYGSDYDKPGHVFMCGTCQAWNSEVAIGFSCMDCGHHMDGEAAPTSDVFAYELTSPAREVITRTQPPLAAEGAAAEPAPARRLPDELAVALRKAGLSPEDGLVLVEIAYGAEKLFVTQDKKPLFDKLRGLFLENLANLLADHGHVVAGVGTDFLVLAKDGDAPLDTFMQSVLANCEGTLAQSIQPSYATLAWDVLPAA